MSTEQTDYSRPLRLGAGSTADDPVDLEARVENSSVLITVDPSASAAVTTLKVLVANLRRLPVQLYLDPAHRDQHLDSNVISHLEGLAAGIDAKRRLHIERPSDVTVHVHIGASSTEALVSGIADGHGTRLRPRGEAFPNELQPGTGLGAVLTAAMLTAEVFKVVVDVLPERQAPLAAVDFCPVTLGEPAQMTLPLHPLARTALVGCGAIGTAIALILRELNAEGHLTVVDPEAYDAPNVTTYSLGDLAAADNETLKVHLVRDQLPNLKVQSYKGTARDYIAAIEAGELTMPETVLGAVDTIDARHEIAAIHATHTFDGSTGGFTGTMLSLSEAAWTGPCLRCYYPQRPTSVPSVIQQLAERTGLSVERLARGTEVLTSLELSVLRNLTPEDRATLQTQVDQPVCGLGKAFGLVGGPADFNPSAAFVAQQAAALVVGCLIRGGNAEQAKFVQYDALFGPYPEMTVIRKPQPSCRCQADQDLHRAVRFHRCA